MLQDTHFTNKEEKYISKHYTYFGSNFLSQSSGVAILFNNNFEFNIPKTEKDTNGNKLLSDITIDVERVL